MLDDLTQVALEVSGPIATLSFSRPDQLNALTQTLVAEALRATRYVADLKEVRVLVVRGAGRAFSAGVDFKAAALPGYSKEAMSNDARAMLDTWQRMPQPTIAAVRGACFAGGFSLAMAADFIVCSEDAVFCDNHAKLGLHSSWGLTQRLPRLVGLQRAKEISFTSRRIGGAEAKAIGLVLDCVADEALDARVAALAQSICDVSGGSVAAYKDLYRLSQNMTLDEGVQNEATARYRIEDRRARQAGAFAPKG
jgi:enoyl-CoA hydratase/carnithine racemase